MKATWSGEKGTIITHIPFSNVICSNSYTSPFDGSSASNAIMALKAIEGISHDICKNPTRTIPSVNVTTTRGITRNLCVYGLATSFNRRPAWRAAIVMHPIVLLVYTYCSPQNPLSSQESSLIQPSYKPTNCQYSLRGHTAS